ncbi:unnamed protein product [Schistosoma mattheei]|uniref:Uncharacterized protein n=1 Tax=Schistosoma mattheei TaxID=31246 RepID=A0AA85BWU9_9TREM|nr:unnamed protein product [Schistosoma mattheei]
MVVCDRPQAVVPWALSSLTQVTKTTSNTVFFSGTSRRTLPQCGQPGSDNRPHTSNSTQDHCIHDHFPSSIPIIPPSSTFTFKLPFSTSPSGVTTANDSSAQNTVPGLLKPLPQTTH